MAKKRWEVSDRTKTVAYVRVSTDKQADHGVSLEAQEAKLRAYADLYGLDLVEVAVDAAVSAQTLDRPALTRVLAMLRSGEADALLVVKLDRLSRATRDVLDLVESSGREGWALHSISEKLDTSSAIGRFVVTIMAALAQMEREQIGERTAATMSTWPRRPIWVKPAEPT